VLFEGYLENVAERELKTFLKGYTFTSMKGMTSIYLSLPWRSSSKYIPILVTGIRISLLNTNLDPDLTSKILFKTRLL
jgi:hypothetical protein